MPLSALYLLTSLRKTKHLPAIILPKYVTLIRKSELIFNRKPLQRALGRF